MFHLIRVDRLIQMDQITGSSLLDYLKALMQEIHCKLQVDARAEETTAPVKAEKGSSGDDKSRD